MLYCFVFLHPFTFPPQPPPLWQSPVCSLNKGLLQTLSLNKFPQVSQQQFHIVIYFSHCVALQRISLLIILVHKFCLLLCLNCILIYSLSFQYQRIEFFIPRFFCYLMKCFIFLLCPVSSITFPFLKQNIFTMLNTTTFATLYVLIF